jgi:hypothetical protein
MTLKNGDVLFTAMTKDGSTAIRHVIQLAQRFDRERPASPVLMASGQGDPIIESIGPGLTQRRLQPGTYRQYRYKDRMKNEVRHCAMWSAEDFLVQRQGTPGYGDDGKLKAAMSPFSTHKPQTVINAQSQQFGQGAKNHALFFCSNFVSRCYATAGEACGLLNPVIPNSHKEISPHDLEGHLQQAAHRQAVDEFVQP